MRRYPDKTCKHCTIIRGSEEECHNTVMELCKILDDIDEITAPEDLELKNSLIKKAKTLFKNLLGESYFAILLDDSGFAMCIEKNGSMYGCNRPELLEEYK